MSAPNARQNCMVKASRRALSRIFYLKLNMSETSGQKRGRRSLNSVTNNSENHQEGFKVVIEYRWSLNLSGR